MSAKRATKTTNVCATIYEGHFDINFDCVGVGVCRFALCHQMPPDGSEECTYREHGTCLNPPAKVTALEALRNKIVRELKEVKEDIENS